MLKIKFPRLGVFGQMVLAAVIIAIAVVAIIN